MGSARQAVRASIGLGALARILQRVNRRTAGDPHSLPVNWDHVAASSVNQALSVPWQIRLLLRSSDERGDHWERFQSHAPLQLLSGCIPAGAFRICHRIVSDARFCPVLNGACCASKGHPSRTQTSRTCRSHWGERMLLVELVGAAFLLLCCAPLLAHDQRRYP